MPKRDPDNIKPPFSAAEVERMREILEEAQINPLDFFKIPQQPDPNQPGMTLDPKVPRGGIKENYNGQKGDGTFKADRENWQPTCYDPFTIRISEVWTPPPAGLAGKLELWAAFATVRAILICRRNDRCRRPLPLGCDHGTEIVFANGEVLGRLNFVFQCAEI